MENCFHVLRWALKTVLIHNQVQMCIDASKGVPHTSWPKLASLDMSLTTKWTFFGRPSSWEFAMALVPLRTSMYTWACTYKSVPTSLYIPICTYECVHTNLYLRASTHKSVHTTLYAQACTQICTDEPVHTNLYVRAHIRTGRGAPQWFCHAFLTIFDQCEEKRRMSRAIWWFYLTEVLTTQYRNTHFHGQHHTK